MNDASAKIKTALVIKVVGQLDTIKRPVLKRMIVHNLTDTPFKYDYELRSFCI